MSIRPSLRRCTVFSRCAWGTSPLSASAENPRAPSFSASSAVALRVRTKTITPSLSSVSRMRVRASSLCMPEATQQRWRMVAAVLVAVRIFTRRGSRRWRSAIFRIAVGMVAEKSATWRCAGMCSSTHSTSSMKPMRSISSASSSTRARNPSTARVPLRMWSITLPGVPTTTCTPRRRRRSWVS